MKLDDLPTPSLVIDLPAVRRNVDRLALYVREHGLKLRPHTKTHKSRRLAAMQVEAGACGVTVAKAGEAQVLADAVDDLLLAYPAVDAPRCRLLAELAKRGKTVRVAVDSAFAADAIADAIAAAAPEAGVTIGVLVDMDVGYGRTGVQTIEQALALAQHIDRTAGLRLDGLFIYPGHVRDTPDAQAAMLQTVEEKTAAAIALWSRHGLEAAIVSGGSTPSAYQSHLMPSVTEIRPGTYIFNDMNCVRGGYCELDDCAARFVATVVSDAVPGQVVIDAGSKTLSSDRNWAAPDSGFGHIVEYPAAKITHLTEEHGQVDISPCDSPPRVGERVTVVPNHVCVCVNLQNEVWWRTDGQAVEPMPVDARGRLW